jgi:uncharacterized membrane protein
VSAALAIGALWLLFAATHMGLSSTGLRPRLASALGERGFLGAYSLVALAVFVPLVWFYLAHRHEGALLWAPAVGSAGRWAIYGLQCVAWSLVAAGLVQPSPVTVGLPEAMRPREASGIHRVTRHPVFMGLGLAGALHLVSPGNGFASDVAFWAGFPVFALIGCLHQDRRKLAGGDAAYRAWHRGTAFLPFTGGAALRGLRELPTFAIPLGVALAVALRWLHGPLFR